MRIIFFGTPDFALPSLKVLVNSGENVMAVVTQPDRVKGRGHVLSPPPVKELAASFGIPVLQPSELTSAEFLDNLSALIPEIIVVVAYGKILPTAILGLPPHGCINLHASILPKYRGAAPIQWAIVRGEKTTGVTTMLMDDGLDTGDTILKETIEILPEDTAPTLSSKLSTMGSRLLLETIDRIKAGSVRPVPQAGEPSYAPIIRKDDGKIDWNRSALDIFNLARGMLPWPGAFGFIQRERVTLIKTKVMGEAAGGVPGIIELLSTNELLVSTGRGALSLIEVKPAGRQSMSGAAFARGRHLKEGMGFELQ